MPERLSPYSLPKNTAELHHGFYPQRVDPESYVLIAGTGNYELSTSVGELLGQEMHRGTREPFPNTEIEVKIPPNVRNRDVFVFQSMYPNPNYTVEEAVLMGDAIDRSDAGRHRIIIPKIAYDRQDRKSESRTPISIAAVAQQLKDVGGYRSILTVDLHAEQSMGTVKGPWDNLYGSKVLVPAIQEEELKDIVVLAPDAGSAKRAEKYASKLGTTDLAVVFKSRKSGSESEALFLVGDVEDRDVVIVDDVTATGGTFINAAQIAKDHGARKVVAAVTHSELVPDRNGVTLIEKLSDPNCPLDKFITTDTIFQSQDIRDNPRIEVVSVAPILAVAIMCYLTGESIGRRLID